MILILERKKGKKEKLDYVINDVIKFFYPTKNIFAHFFPYTKKKNIFFNIIKEKRERKEEENRAKRLIVKIDMCHIYSFFHLLIVSFLIFENKGIKMLSFARPTLLFSLPLLLGGVAIKAEELKIKNADELVDFSNDVSNGKSYSGTTVYLDSDIDFNPSLSQQFQP